MLEKIFKFFSCRDFKERETSDSVTMYLYLAANFIVLTYIQKLIIYFNEDKNENGFYLTFKTFMSNNYKFSFMSLLLTLVVLISSFATFGFHVPLVGFFLFLIEKLTILYVRPAIFKESSSVEECLAFAFYKNYLKHVLPGFNRRLKDACLKIGNNYEGSNMTKNVFIINKLIILIPLSGNVENYQLLTDADPRIKKITQLEPVRIEIAGKPNREYINTVYHVGVESMPPEMYCVSEFATPLVSLHKILVSSSDKRPSDQALQERIRVFHSMLKQILDENCNETRDSCELVLYGDVNVADVLAKTVHKINEEKKCKN